MKKSYYYLVLFASLLSTSLSGQILTADWANSMGGESIDKGNSISMSGASISDIDGNILITGEFRETAEFDNSGHNKVELTSNGKSDTYIQKLGADGRFIWLRRFGNELSSRGLSIASNTMGDVFVTGSFSGLVDLNPGKDEFLLRSIGPSDMFLLKLDQDGVFQFAKRIGQLGNEEGKVVKIGASGAIYIVGSTIEPEGQVVPNLKAKAMNKNIVIRKFDDNGESLWHKVVAGKFEDKVSSLALDDDENLYLTGSFEDMVDFDPTSKETFLESKGKKDAFIVKFNADGDMVWEKSFGGFQDEMGNSVKIDPAGNIIITGNIMKNRYSPKPLSGAGNYKRAMHSDYFVKKMSSDGEPLWHRTFGGGQNDIGMDLCVDLVGNIYVTGSFEGRSNFGRGVNPVELDAEGKGDIFVQKLNPEGILISVKSIGSMNAEQGSSIVCGSPGEVLLMGSFEKQLNVDPDGRGIFLNSKGMQDIFIMKLVSTSIAVEAKEMNEALDVGVYPNPVTGTLNIDARNESNLSFEILDILGKTVNKGINNSRITPIDLSDYTPGIYYVKLSNESQQIIYKIIKE